MNILELENLVKGVPDDQLIKEVQAPSGRIPQFLALSEVQRRKDMRDRYQAQQNGGQKPTIAEQIVGGGIGSLPGAQGAPVPTPAATGMPSAGTPPVASGAAPMPVPPGMPQGFAAGGQVGYAAGGPVTTADLIKQMAAAKGDKPRNAKDYMEGYWEKNFPGLMAAKEFLTSPMYEYPEVYLRGAMQGDPDRPQTASGAFDPISAKLKARDAARVAEAQQVPASPLPAMLRAPGAPAPIAAVAAPVAASIPTPVPAPSGAGEAYVATAGGIGAFNPNEAVSGGAGPAASVSGPAPAVSIPGAGGAPSVAIPGISADEQKLVDYLRNEENFKLPEALSYQTFIDEAMGEEQSIRAEAKKQALGAALVQLGAGLAAGDMAKGLSTAGIESRDIMSQGRKEASAQKALAQQFKLQGMEGERDVKLKQMEATTNRLTAMANISGGYRKEREDRAMEQARLYQSAAQHAATIGIQTQQLGLSKERAEIERRSAAMDYYKSAVANAIGPEPTKQEIESAIMKGLPNPMDEYRQRAAQAGKIIAPEVEGLFRVPAKTLYADVVKPVSNPGGSAMQIGRFTVKPN
jgi:hypothetical protein